MIHRPPWRIPISAMPSQPVRTRGRGHRPGVIAHEGVGVAVVHVARIAPEHGPEAALLIGPVDRVEVLRGWVGPLAAQERGGGQELGIGDRDGPVDGGHDDVDVRVVGSPVVGRDGQHRLVVLAVPVTGQGVLRARARPCSASPEHRCRRCWPRPPASTAAARPGRRTRRRIPPPTGCRSGPGRRSAGSSGSRGLWSPAGGLDRVTAINIAYNVSHSARWRQPPDRR